MSEVAKKRKGYHWVSDARVSHRARQLRRVVVCYDPSVTDELSISLTMCL